MTRRLEGKVALVAGATRGAGPRDPAFIADGSAVTVRRGVRF